MNVIKTFAVKDLSCYHVSRQTFFAIDFVKLIKSNLKYALNAVNIEKIVKDKINALPLPEVENILFSFMKEHFKWINILGFFIGFVIGLTQALIVFFTGV